jgi:hypothetical protein
VYELRPKPFGSDILLSTTLTGRIIMVEWGRGGKWHKQHKKVVNMLHVQECIQLREDLRERDAQRDDWYFNLLASTLHKCWRRSG